MSKVYPLLALTLGTTSAVAEASTFVPVKGAVNALSLLLDSKFLELHLQFRTVALHLLEDPIARCSDAAPLNST